MIKVRRISKRSNNTVDFFPNSPDTAAVELTQQIAKAAAAHPELVLNVAFLLSDDENTLVQEWQFPSEQAAAAFKVTLMEQIPTLNDVRTDYYTNHGHVLISNTLSKDDTLLSSVTIVS